jgi:hypothetical protein
MAQLDVDLADALATASPGTQRSIARWAARRACEVAGIADLDWVAPALEAIELPHVTTKRAANLRRRHGFPPAGRWPPDYVVKHPSLMAAVPSGDLAALRAGLQPIRPGGYFLCRECGRWFASLAIHLGSTHGVTVAAYRKRHGISTDLALHRSKKQLALLAEIDRIWTERQTPAGPGPDHAYAYRCRHGHLDVPSSTAPTTVFSSVSGSPTSRSGMRAGTCRATRPGHSKQSECTGCGRYPA